MSINAILTTRIKDTEKKHHTALELFEDNGYTCEQTSDQIIYTRVRKNRINRIIFDKTEVTFTAQTEKGGEITPYHVRMSLLSAILKQIEELDWHIAHTNK